MRGKRMSRHIKRFFNVTDITAESLRTHPNVLGLISGLPDFINYLDQALDQSEKMAELSSRALEISSKELTDANTRLQSLNQTIQAMINSLAEGFVVFNPKGVCDGISSRRASELFGEELAGKHICDLLQVQEDERVGFMEWYEFMFTPGVDVENIAALGPATLDHPSLYITLKYKPILEGGRVMSIVLILSDFTAEREALRESEHLRNYSEMLKRFFADRENFVRVLDAIRVQLQELSVCKIKALNDHESILRQLHNIKGMAGLLSAMDLVKAAHEAENALILEWSRSTLPSDFEPMVHTAANMVLDRYNEFMREHSSMLGLHRQMPKNSTIVSSDVLQEFYLKLKSAQADALAQEFAAKLLLTPLHSPLAELESHALSLAKSLGKKISVKLEVNAQDQIFGIRYRKFFDSLFHMINNALDHAFADDTKHWNLTIGGAVHGTQSIKVCIQDDGSGIDPDVIRHRLYQMQINCSRETDAQVIYHIFDPGFSTKAAVSETSGRGIGMDAVHFEVKKLGGKIEVSSEKGHGTKFVITLPYLSPESEIRKAA